MTESADQLARLARSWDVNAEAWARVIGEERIESRKVATDSAILHAVLQRSPARVLDLGCGEGWLCRALESAGVEAVGVDGSASLVRAARQRGGGAYHVLSYEDLTRRPDVLGSPFDAVVCNFSLLHEVLEPLLAALAETIAPGGVLIIQTVHPWTSCGDGPYRDGWRTESFAGFGDEFSEPMPWYFRTLQSWSETLARCGFQPLHIQEPRHPATDVQLSLLIVADRQRPCRDYRSDFRTSTIS